jgi:hypothetical protein
VERRFFKETVKGDVNKLIDMIHQVRDLELDAYPRKFVEDNMQVCFLRQNANIDKASKEIRKLIKQELDQNNPSVTLVNHITTVLTQMPELNNVFIKLKGLLGMKGDLHRSFSLIDWWRPSRHRFQQRRRDLQRKGLFDQAFHPIQRQVGPC